MNEIRSALNILPEIRKGIAVAELSQAIHDATEAVRLQGKAAVIRFEVTIQPYKGMHKLIEPPIVISAETTTKLPKPEQEATLFFLDEDGNPTQNMQQRERELPLRPVSDEQKDGTHDD